MYVTADIYQKGELYLPLLKNGNNCVGTTEIDWYIDFYEKEIYREILGQLFYAIPETFDDGDKWDILINGGDYECCGKNYNFRGIKYIAACFIYFIYVREKAQITATTGGKVPKYELGEHTSLRGKAKRNWNNATRLIKSSRCGASVNTLHHYLTCSDFEDYCVNFYNGGLITDL